MHLWQNLETLRKSKETYGQTRGLINSSQKQFTCFYKMFCCFQHFSWSNIVKLIMVLLTKFKKSCKNSVDHKICNGDYDDVFDQGILDKYEYFFNLGKK